MLWYRDVNIKTKIMIFYLNCYFRIFGHAPIGLKCFKLNQSSNFRCVFIQSLIGKQYNILLTLLLIILSITHYYFDAYCRDSESKSKLQNLFQTSRLISVLGTVSVILKFSIQLKELHAILNKLCSISEFNVEPVIMKNFLVIVSTNIIQLLRITFFWWNPYSIHYYSFISEHKIAFFLEIFTKIFIDSVLMQYSLTLQLIESSIEFLNNHMIETLKSSNIAYDINLRIKFEKYSKLHGLLCDTSHELSNYYSLPLLLLIMITFNSVLRNSYWFIQSMFFV